MISELIASERSLQPNQICVTSTMLCPWRPSLLRARIPIPILISIPISIILNGIELEWNGIESVVSSVCLWCPEIKWMRICWLYFYFLFCRSTFTCDMWFEFTYDSCVRALLVRHCEWMKTRKYCTGDKHTVTVKNFTTIQMRSRFHCYVLYILLVWGHTVDELWKKLNENGE